MLNKLRFFLLIIIFVLIITMFLLWTSMDVLKSGLNTSSIVMFIATAILVIFAIYAIRKVRTSLKRGDPLKDERTRKIEMRASAFSFYISIYWLLALGFSIDYFKLEIPPSSVPGLGILGMAIFLGFSYWFFSKKGE